MLRGGGLFLAMIFTDCCLDDGLPADVIPRLSAFSSLDVDLSRLRPAAVYDAFLAPKASKSYTFTNFFDSV